MSGDPTAAREWREAHERVCGLVESTNEASHDATVPACPDWTVRELLAHMIGVGVDALAGTESDDHDAAWTQGHVDERAGRPVAALLQEWRDAADAIEAHVGGTDPSPMGDVLIHEQDLRGALDAPGARDTAGLATVREFMAGGLAEQLSGRPPLRLESPGWTWQSADGEPGAVLAASTYDLTRALASRRTADQLRSWLSAGDVEPYLDAFAAVGPLPDAERPE